MITSGEVLNILYHILNDSVLSQMITGIICRKRPVDSNKEDIVINSLGMPNLQLQTGVINVNIHVPNIQLSSGPNQDVTQGNYPRMTELSKIAVSILDDYYSPDGMYSFSVQQEGIFEDADDDAATPDHYVNIRLIVNYVNI